MGSTPKVYVSGSFDDLRSMGVLFLQAAAEVGRVTALIWTDEVHLSMTGCLPCFPFEERCYILQALRYVEKIRVVDEAYDPDTLPYSPDEDAVWFVPADEDKQKKRDFCLKNKFELKTYTQHAVHVFPLLHYDPLVEENNQKKVLVTGSFDWLHSGHVRFFEECSQMGYLYVIVGHDENIQLLKGEGHPMFPQHERLFMVQSIRYVKRAMISTGHGWMDAAPQVEMIRPDIYVVNQDGNVEEKRRFCEERGIEYRVLQRLPKHGLLPRQSTLLRESMRNPSKGKDSTSTPL